MCTVGITYLVVRLLLAQLGNILWYIAMHLSVEVTDS